MIYRIYTIRDLNDNTGIYVGITKQKLTNRFSCHKSNYKSSVNKYVYNTYNGDWKSMYIELYEIFESDDKELLHKREGEIIREIGTINRNIAGRTNLERYTNDQEYKTKQLEYQKEKYNNDPEFRKKQLKTMNERYTNDQEYKTKQLEYQKEKYDNDTEFKNKIKKRSKLNYLNKKKNSSKDNTPDDIGNEKEN